MLNPKLLRKTHKNNFFSLVILFFCCFVAFWPLSFNVFSLKNDALNYFLPVRYQISESINYGYWPFWSPYFNLGYPLHGDMQSGVWNPIVQILSLFGPYQLKTLQDETLIYIYLSGVGMFFLMNHFIKEWRICLFVSASFMLSGYNTDSTQFLNWISSASFLPFVFLFYFRTITEKNKINAPIAAFFIYLLFTTAYPADFILTMYLLLFVLVWHLSSKENRKSHLLFQQLKLHAILIVVFTLLSMPAIISYAEFLQFSQRGSGASYEEAMSNPLHPLLLISYFAPLSVWKAHFAEITDPLTRNSYIGLFGIGLLITSFILRFNHRFIKFLKWGFLISFVFSLGEIGVLRVVSYYALPLMDSFRHPSNARLFSIFFACMLAGFTLFQLLKKPQLFIWSKKLTWYIILLLFTLLLLISVTGNSNISSFEFNIREIKQFIDTLDFYQLLSINIIIQIPFLITFYFFYVKKINLNILILGSLVNLILLTALYQPFPVVKKDPVNKIQKIINEVKIVGYPKIDLTKTLAENSADGMQYFKEIGVSNMYNKKIGRVNYRITPSNLNSQNEFWSNEKIRMHFLTYPLLYKADTIIDIKDTANLFFSNKKILLSESYPIKPTSTNQKYKVIVNEMSPLHMKIEINCAEEGYYNLFQNFYPRWQLRIDNKPYKIERTNISFIGFKLAPGTHQISLDYFYNDLVITYVISSIVSFLIIIWVIIYWSRKLLEVDY